jgi:hypothetical protein
MKALTRLLLILFAAAVSGTVLAKAGDQDDFFAMQRMITDGYPGPDGYQAPMPAKAPQSASTRQEMPRKERASSQAM